MAALVVALPLGILPGCSKSVGTQTDELVKYARAHPIGQFENIWLEQQEPTGEWDKVALVFGWVENGKACEDMKAALAASGSDTYRCVPVAEKD